MSLINILNKDTSINRKPVLKTIDIDDIIINEKNNHNRVERNIDDLVASIKKQGLLKPLEVYENADGDYVLIGGERRYTAIKKILAEDEDFDSEVSCLVYKVLSKADEILKLHLSNAQEELTEEDKLFICKDLLELLEKEPQLKPANKKTREWLAPYLGCSPRSVQPLINKIKAKASGDTYEDKTTEVENEKAKNSLSKSKASRKIANKLNKIAQELDSLDDDYLTQNEIQINCGSLTITNLLAILTEEISKYSSTVVEEGEQ